MADTTPLQSGRAFGRFSSLYESTSTAEALSLEALLRDAYIGNFAKVDVALNDHDFASSNRFLYVITRVDCASRQSRYHDISNTVRTALESQAATGCGTYTRQQTEVLLLFQAYANIFTKGAIKNGVNRARNIRTWLDLGENETGDVERLAVELWLRIMQAAKTNSTYVDDDLLTYPPQGDSQSTWQTWTGFDTYCRVLEDNGLFWDSLTVLKILAPVQSTEWGLENYRRLLERTSGSPPSDYNTLCCIAVQLAFARFSISKGEVDDGVARLEMVRSRMDANASTAGSRQQLEYYLGDAEASEKRSDYRTSLRKWRRAAEIAKQSNDFGLESHCMTKYMQIAGNQDDRTEFLRYSDRLEEVEANIEGDIPSTVRTKLGLWHRCTSDGFGNLLAWFQAFDIEHPLSNALTSNNLSEQGEGEWDLPCERYREEVFKYHYFTRLGNSDFAQESLEKASKICQFVPWSFMKNAWLFEWEDTLTAEAKPVQTVLLNRIKSHCGSSTDSVSLSFIRDFFDVATLEQSGLSHFVANLTAEAITIHLFKLSPSPDVLLQKLGLVKWWFDETRKFNRSASLLIIAQLRLAYLKHVFSSPTSAEIVAKLSSDFVDHVEQLSDPEVKDFLVRYSLHERQRASDGFLFQYWPSLPKDRLRQLLNEYRTTLTLYQASKYSNDRASVALLYARLGEVELFLEEDDNYLARFQAYLDKTEELYSSLRNDLNSLSHSMSMQLRSSLRASVGGHQVVLKRAIANLLVQYNSPQTTVNHRDSIASMLWNFVQRVKSRALLDKLSHGQLGNVDLIRESGNSGGSSANASASPVTSNENVETEESLSERMKKVDIDSDAPTEHDVPTLSDISPLEKLDISAILSRRSKGDATTTASLRGHTVTIEELLETTSNHSGGLVFVDWFAADTPQALRALHMIVWRASPNYSVPVIRRLTPGIGPKTMNWVGTYLAPGTKNLELPEAFEHLQTLRALVEPLATLTGPGENIVFCPTSEWNVHRVPLHAIELSDEGASSEDSESIDHIMFLRNRIAYTYSHSLIHANMKARQSTNLEDWHASVVSPLSELPPGPHRLPLIEAFSGAKTRRIGSTSNKLADFVNASIIAATDITDRLVAQQIQHADFFYFLGHVHGQSGQSTNPLAQHMMLFHPQVNPVCSEGGTHELGTAISAELILANCSMKQGALAAILGCGSGIPTYTAVDEPLGLVSAFLFCGASSVVTALWNIQVDDACYWTNDFQQRWQEEESRTRQASSPGNVDLLTCFQDAVRNIVEKHGKSELWRWGAFVYYGYWMFPTRPDAG